MRSSHHSGNAENGKTEEAINTISAYFSWQEIKISWCGKSFCVCVAFYWLVNKEAAFSQ